MKTIVPFVTCEITFGQNVCELMFRINVSNLNLESRLIMSNNQSKATLWVLDTCLIVGLRPSFDHLNHGFIVLKDIQHSFGNNMCFAWFNAINVGQIKIGVRNENLFLHVRLSVCRQVSSWLSYIFGFVGLVRNEILQSLNPKDRERESHPCVNLHRERFL